ncbi:LysR family transcriptional regulator [Tengunoibacter tsumagoiensis]|nr:LysR family transcriptional regulator [Tengunoibacter tsumagoiensis]
MEFQQLTYFLAAAQTQNFRKAADICLVAQSALSRQIAQLEDELEVELFTRKNQRVTLTPAGQEFAQYVKGALDQLQQGKQSLSTLQAGQMGTITLGCVEALAAAFLPPLFADFHQHYPLVRLKVRVNHTAELITMVEQGEVDCALILDPTMHSEILIVKEIFRQPLQLLVPEEHALAQEQMPITLKRLVEEPLILLHESSKLGQITRRILAQRGLSARPLIEIESVEGLKECVRQGLGVTMLLPALIRTPLSHNGLVLRPIVDLTEEFIFALIYRRTGTLSAPARLFIRTIADATVLTEKNVEQR